MLVVAPWLILILCNLAVFADAVDNNFGRTPAMGYNTYNAYSCRPNQTIVRTEIEALANAGFVTAGYKLFNLDCGWQGYKRQQNGSIIYDDRAFPGGIAPLSQLANSRGMDWAMYTNQGTFSCDSQYDRLRPGSLGFEQQDALMFKAWNTKYVKVDNCFIEGATNNAPKEPRTDFPSRFGKMTKQLQDPVIGIHGIMICQWGVPNRNTTTGRLEGPSAWAPSLSTSYRISDDIAPGWSNVVRIYNQAIQVSLNGLSGLGHFADLDMLEVGNPGMSITEQQSHFALWAMFKSALFISTKTKQLSKEAKAILLNKELISINQDPLGKPVTLIQRFSGNYDLFQGPLANGDRAILLIDLSGRSRTHTITFKDLRIASASVKELWTGRTFISTSSYAASIPAHGSIPLRLSEIAPLNIPATSLTYFEAEQALLDGGAATARCRSCSEGFKVGNITGGASVTFSNISASSTTLDVSFDYIHCEIGFMGDRTLNQRAALVAVNGGTPVQVMFPVTGYDWEGDRLEGFKVRLVGFAVGEKNRLTIKAARWSKYAPDIDRIGVPR